jgi:hypothetical protein
MKTAQISKTPVEDARQVVRRTDPLAVLQEVLELERESKPDLKVDEMLLFAVANPKTEVVDSLGAVSVVCVLYGAYTPENLIPPHLLTHANFSTLDGLRRVTNELDKREARQCKQTSD